MVIFTLWLFNALYSLSRRICETQNRSGNFRKEKIFLPLPVIEPHPIVLILIILIILLTRVTNLEASHCAVFFRTLFFFISLFIFSVVLYLASLFTERNNPELRTGY